MTTAPERRYPERNSTSDRTLIILEMFTDERSSITANEVGERLGIARSTAYRYLQPLVARGFLEDDKHGFRLGFKILQLSRLARKNFGLAELATPIMEQLAEQFQQTVLLTRRVDTAVVCVERRDPADQLIRLSYEPGSRLPINAGASAFALLMGLNDEELRELLARSPLSRFTDETVIEPEAIIDLVRASERQGHSLTVSDLDVDVMGIAVPIRDERGRAVAALSVVALENRLTAADRETVILALQQTSDEIGALARNISN